MAREEKDRIARKLRAILIEERKAAGLTQEALAARLGRPQSFVSNYERGAGGVGVGDFLLIARALELDPKELLGRLE